MRFALKCLTTLVAGVALGLFATWATVGRGVGIGGGVANGPWHTSLLTGSAQSGLYLRAAVALHGLLALGRDETIYYTAVTDSTGDWLRAGCRYTLAGRDPPARWWSITAYDGDDYLIPGSHRYSVTKNSVERAWDGSFAVTVAQDADTANAIDAGNGAFSLTLRLYNPDPAVAADPARVALPGIHREHCE
jgi:hypothetical protein